MHRPHTHIKYLIFSKQKLKAKLLPTVKHAGFSWKNAVGNNEVFGRIHNKIVRRSH